LSLRVLAFDVRGRGNADPAEVPYGDEQQILPAAAIEAIGEHQGGAVAGQQPHNRS
jgi:hypothetical protein